MMTKLGLTQEKLAKLGALESMLKGYKPPMLVPVIINLGTTTGIIEARLSLHTNNSGDAELRFHAKNA